MIRHQDKINQSFFVKHTLYYYINVKYSQIHV